MAFLDGALSASTALVPGFYAPAYRFVHLQTGQATALVPLPTVQVNAALFPHC